MLQPQKQKSIIDPATQVLLSLRRGGKRFQLICNRDAMNKFRAANKGKKPADIKVSGAEIDEILTNKTVFTNAAKAEVAKPADVAAAFEKMSEAEVLQTMLARGEVQTNEGDRQATSHETHDLLSQAVTIVAKKVFNPTPAPKEAGAARSRNYTVDEIDREVKNMKFTCKPNRTPESLALSIIRALKITDTLPVQRQQLKFKADLENPKNSSLVDKLKTSQGYALVVGTLAADAKSVDFILDAALDAEWRKQFILTKVSNDAFAPPASAEEDLTVAEDEEGQKESGSKAGGKKAGKDKKEKAGAAAASAAAGGDSDDEDDKGKGKKGKGKAKDRKAQKKEEEEGIELAKDDEGAAAAPPKAPAKKAGGKGGKKGGDDSDDDAPRRGRGGRGKGGDLEAELAALGGKKGGSDDDDSDGPGGSNPFAQLAGGKKKKKKGAK